MPKRKLISLEGPVRRNRRLKQYYRSAPAATLTALAMQPVQRAGYGSVQRTRGAAVTGEMKYFDCELPNQAISVVTTTWVAGTAVDPSTTINLGSAAVATPLCLFAPTVGAALNQRIGRKVKMLKVKVRGFFNVPLQAAQNAADTATTLRLLLVLDMQTNASQMTGAQLLNDASTAAATVNSFQNPNNFGRFKVLKDMVKVVQNPNMAGEIAAANVVSQGLIVPFKCGYSFKQPIQVNFNATNGGTVADIIDNSLHIVCGANSISLAPTISYYTRVSYKE